MAEVAVTDYRAAMGEQFVDRIRSVLPSNRLWICRGAVRCCLLGELEPWDDFDIVTDATERDLGDALIALRTKISRTFHGGFSLAVRRRKVDIWPLETNMGRRSETLVEALAAFEFNVDAIAVDLADGELVDPLQVRNAIETRRLRVQQLQVSAVSGGYLAIKAAYLAMRHRLTPDTRIEDLWHANPTLETPAAAALKRELKALGITQRSPHVRFLMAEWPTIGKYVSALLTQ